MPEITLVVHNIRSTYNVGSIFRSAESFGVREIIFSGYTPYPKLAKDHRLPHISEKLTSQIHKTALGTELLVPFRYEEDPPIKELREQGFRVVGLEQDARSVSLVNYSSPIKIALIIGEEVAGIHAELRVQCDDIIEIPMNGTKESLNVSVATGIALYALRNTT